MPIGFLAPELNADDFEDIDEATEKEIEQVEARVLDEATAARTVVELKVEIETLSRLEALALRVRRAGRDTKWRELAGTVR